MIKGGLIYPQLQRLGKISIGEKGETRTSAKGTTFQPPRKLDYFSIKTHYRTAAGQLADDTSVMERLGKQPKELKIRLPFNDLEKNFQCELRYYKGGMLYCSGDGEQGYRREERFVNGKPVYGEAKPFGPCGRACPDFQSRNCKRFGALRVILEEQQQVGGVYEYRTTSRHSIENILSGLLTIQLQTGGVLAWLPLTMRLVPQTVMTPDNKTTRVYVIQIVFPGSPQTLLETVRDILALRAPLLSEIKALEAGMPMIEDNPIEAKETQDEFYPDQSQAMLPEMPTPSLDSSDQPPVPDTIIRAIIATLEHHRPYAGARDGAYTKFIPAEAMTIIRDLFGVSKASDLKALSMDRLEQGYEDLLDLVAPGEAKEELDVMDAELLDDDHGIDVVVMEDDPTDDDVLLTPGPDGSSLLRAETSGDDPSPDTLETRVQPQGSEEALRAYDGESVDSGETSATIVEPDSVDTWRWKGVPAVDIDADGLPRVDVDADGLVSLDAMAALKARAEQSGQRLLLMEILEDAERITVGQFRYAWVQVRPKPEKVTR